MSGAKPQEGSSPHPSRGQSVSQGGGERERGRKRASVRHTGLPHLQHWNCGGTGSAVSSDIDVTNLPSPEWVYLESGRRGHAPCGAHRARSLGLVASCPTQKARPGARGHTCLGLGEASTTSLEKKWTWFPYTEVTQSQKNKRGGGIRPGQDPSPFSMTVIM